MMNEVAETAIRHGACQKPWELAEFLDMLVDYKPKVIVEIGVFAGGTLYAWSRVAPNPTVIGIDLMPSGSYPVYASNGKPRDEHGATVIVGDSHDWKTVAALAKCLDGHPIDCLFIDGDHTYDGVRQDYEMYRPLVKVGGLIAFHDIVTHQYALNCEVVKLWTEIKDESAVEIIDPEGDSWGGIGVLTNMVMTKSNTPKMPNTSKQMPKVQRPKKPYK
jgi:predicted O-methyltransferase YrrM